MNSVPRARRALVYANIMIILGQATGVNAIMYYMSVLMKAIGFDDENANYMSLVGGGSLLIGTIPAIFLMETCGRRFWAIMMLPGFFIGLVLIGIANLYDPKTNLQAAEGIYLTGLIIYMGFFGSYACLTWGKLSSRWSYVAPDLLTRFYSGTVGGLSHIPAKLRHDYIRCSPFLGLIHRYLQLQRHEGCNDPHRTHAWFLWRHCYHR